MPRQLGHQLRYVFAQLASIKNHVDGARLQQKFSALKSFRQGFTDRVFNHTRTGETDQGFGLGNHHITQESKAGRHTTHGGVRQHADVRHFGFGQSRQRCIGFGHLHQTQQTFLHACAAGGREADEGSFLLNGHFHATNKTLTHHRAHGAAHEVKFKAGGHHGDAVQRTTHHDQGIGFAGVLQRFLEAIGVFFAVFETQRVNRQHFLTNFEPPFGVEKSIQTSTCTNTVVVAAFRANIDVLL